MRDEHVQRARRGLGELFLPELVEQAIARHGLVRAQEEREQERALLAARHLDLATVVAHLERAQQEELHRADLRSTVPFGHA